MFRFGLLGSQFGLHLAEPSRSSRSRPAVVGAQAAAATLFWFDQNDFTYQNALIAVLIVLGCIGGAFLFGKHKICKRPQCRQEITPDDDSRL